MSLKDPSAADEVNQSAAKRATPRVVVAGHICLDIIPDFPALKGEISDVLKPGSLVEIGPAVLSTGGAVSNTGLALYRLGVDTQLMGLVGNDLFGGAILDVLRGYDDALADGMLIAEDVNTSYTVVINPPQIDRVFLHAAGANNHFKADHIRYGDLDAASLFHFGYPPLMEQFYAGATDELGRMFARAKEHDVVTTLDLAYPDPSAPAGKADWVSILSHALPHVDCFLPSIEEILFMLDRKRFEALSAAGDVLAGVDRALLEDLTQRLLEMGCAVAGLKLGHRGLFMQTTSDPQRLAPLRKLLPQTFDSWIGQQAATPCYQVEVAGTTGCGDCTIAGFIAGLVHGLSLEETLRTAVGVGAATAEQPDATSGVPPWDQLQQRIASGWELRPAEF